MTARALLVLGSILVAAPVATAAAPHAVAPPAPAPPAPAPVPPAPHAPHAPASPAQPPVAAATVDTGPYDLVLVDPGLHLIAVIRELRDATGLELRDVKALVDECPRTIELALPRPDADALRVRLESAGARVDLRRAVKAG